MRPKRGPFSPSPCDARAQRPGFCGAAKPGESLGIILIHRVSLAPHRSIQGVTLDTTTKPYLFIAIGVPTEAARQRSLDALKLWIVLGAFVIAFSFLASLVLLKMKKLSAAYTRRYVAHTVVIADL